MAKGSPHAQLDPDVRLARHGVQTVTAPDAGRAAVELARRTGGEVLCDAISAEAAFEVRMHNAGVPRIGTSDIAQLRRLADELTRAQRIRARTRADVTETIARRVAGSGVELHPSALRDAAQAVSDLEAELAPLQAELASLDEPIVPERVRATDGALPAMFDEAAVEATRYRIASTVTMVGFAVLALVLLALSTPVLAPVAVFVIGVAVTVLIVRRGRSAGSGDAEMPESTQRLAMLDRADIRAEERRRLVRRTALETSVARVSERLLSARRRWESVAGDSADRQDIEAVLRKRDPQYDLSGAGDSSPTIRAVDSLHRWALARWRVAWAEVGVDEPPDPEDCDSGLEAVTRDAGPLVLVDPLRWLSAERLSELVDELPEHAEVYIVTQV